MALVCYLHVCRQRYIFLSHCQQLADNDYASLQCSTNNISGHSASHVSYPAYWESTAPSKLQLMAVVANCFCAIVAMHTLAMITSSAMHAIKVYLPHVYP